MSKPYVYTIETIDLQTPAGATVNHMSELACAAALENCCSARFVHNDKVYIVTFDDLINQVRKISPKGYPPVNLENEK